MKKRGRRNVDVGWRFGLIVAVGIVLVMSGALLLLPPVDPPRVGVSNTRIPIENTRLSQWVGTPTSIQSVPTVNVSSTTPSPIQSPRIVKDTTTEIVWTEDRMLTYDDFKGAPPPDTGRTAAESSTGVAINSSSKASCQRVGEYICTVRFSDISVEARFNTQASWMSSDGNVGYVLSHEQLHFDIAELAARKFRQSIPRLLTKVFEFRDREVQKAVHEGEVELDAYMDDVYARVDRELNAMQDQYDRETNHGTIDDTQEYWQKTIREKLSELK